MDFDFETYLSHLEFFRVPAPPPPSPNARLAEWRWPPLKPYNGFAGGQRAWVWQLHRWAFDAGTLLRPRLCAVCGSSSRVGFHGENYADPWTSIALCYRCHMAVHGRFRSPDAWGRFQAAHSRGDVAGWLAMLPARPIDLAGWLIRKNAK